MLWLLLVDCRWLVGVCWLSDAACCLSPAVCGLLFAVCCLTPRVDCCSLLVVRFLVLFADWRLPLIVCGICSLCRSRCL